MLNRMPLLRQVSSNLRDSVIDASSLSSAAARTSGAVQMRSSVSMISRRLSQTTLSAPATHLMQIQERLNTHDESLPSQINLPRNSKAKTVVIIGGRSQLGEALRRRFLTSEWHVVCTTQGKSTHKLDASGFHLVGDINLGEEKVRTKEYWVELFKKITFEQGTIHTVVNCAGISINDPKNGYTMDDINRKPVAPMLEACIALGIDRYTFISTQAVKYPEARKPGSYSKSKYDAELDIDRVMVSQMGANTQASIVRPDLIISADNPGHFGSPQRMSTVPFIKLTVGEDPRKAGSTILQPVVADDVADAVVHISDYNIDTPEPIDACGPEVLTIEDMISFFKARQLKSFVMGIKIPRNAVAPAAAVRPWGAFEQDHLDLIAHHEKNQIGKVDTTEFERIVALTRPDNSNSLITLKEVFDFTKRPVYGTHDLGLYSKSLLKQLKAQDLLPLCKGIAMGIVHSRIDFNPSKKTAERGPNDGINLGVLLASTIGISLAASFYKSAHSTNKSSDTQYKNLIKITG